MTGEGVTRSITTIIDTIGKEERIMSSEKILIERVSKSFSPKSRRDAGERFVAISNVSLTVEEGEFLSIVGPSGCGKSTLLDLLAGLEPASSGSILVNGRPINGPDQEIGIVLQGYALFPWRTVRKNVEFGLEIRELGKKERREVSQRYIELVGLTGFEDSYPHELSGGMRQRVAIARALAYDPAVLLMDEPFAAVDAQTRELLQEELLRIWERTGKTIVFITHSIEEAIFLSDRVAVMSRNPGTIKEIVEVTVPRPRHADRASLGFSRLRHHLWELLQDEGDFDGLRASASERRAVIEEAEGLLASASAATATSPAASASTATSPAAATSASTSPAASAVAQGA
jgi:NitT/TauT family transport system ATP-binding protein